MIGTMTTVGYGDYTPNDPIGRVVSSFACVCGIVLLALTSMVVTDSLSLSNFETTLLRRVLDNELEKVEMEAAALLVQQVWRVRGALTRRALSVERVPPLVGDLCLTSGDAPTTAPATAPATAPSTAPAAPSFRGRRVMRRTASSALAASTTALNTRHVRLMLLHRVQRQREQRRLLNLESLSDPGTMSTMVRRMDALEQRVAADMQALREMHHAQAEALAKLINRIEQLAAPAPVAAGANGQPIDAAASPLPRG
jgi:hypothetical protein